MQVFGKQRWHLQVKAWIRTRILTLQEIDSVGCNCNENVEIEIGNLEEAGREVEWKC